MSDKRNIFDLVAGPFIKTDKGLDSEGAAKVEFMVKNKKGVKPSKKMLAILNSLSKKDK